MNTDLEKRVQKIADENGVHFAICWRKLLMERFLARLSRSAHADKLIFKGGFLLAYIMEIGRETKDLDFALTRMKAGTNEIKHVMNEITSIPSQDEFTLSFNKIEELKQPHMNYTGYRVTLNANFAKNLDFIKIDLGIGDIVTPKEYTLYFSQPDGKPFFDSEEYISLLVYPVETIFAEKLETVISKGFWNTRVKEDHPGNRYLS